jgi:hypothetical protein
LGLENIEANAPFTPGLSVASFFIEKIFSIVLATGAAVVPKGPATVLINLCPPIGLVNPGYEVSVGVVGTILAPSAITPGQSLICNFTLIFKAIAAAFVALKGPTFVPPLVSRLLSAKSRSPSTKA